MRLISFSRFPCHAKCELIQVKLKAKVLCVLDLKEEMAPSNKKKEKANKFGVTAYQATSKFEPFTHSPHLKKLPWAS